MRSSHVWMNCNVKNWMLLKAFILKYVFWRAGKSRCIWRKIKTIKRYDNLISRFASKVHKKKQDQWICFKKGGLDFQFHSPKNNLNLFIAVKKFHFTWIAIHITDNSNINTNIKSLTWKSARRHPSVKTRIMVKPINWFSLSFKWLSSTLHKISHRETVAQTLKPPGLLKIVKNALKLLKLLLKD